MIKGDTPLSSGLSELKNSGRYPMHMPGHKRNTQLVGSISDFYLPYDIDITEIEGFDNLHCRTGVLAQLSERCARLYGAKYAFPLVGGSTCGILSCIRAVTKPNDKIIMARNCHMSVYHAVSLCSLEAEYIYTEYCCGSGIIGSVTPRQVREAFESDPDAKALVITSPTYEGVISDIEEIAKIVHKFGALLVVDAAHGAHLSLSKNNFLPENKICCADAAVVSLHKTLPALTQTALALVFGDNADKIESSLSRQIDIFETSSPSYILLSSIEQCVNILENYGDSLFKAWKSRIDLFEENILKLENLRIFGYGEKAPDLFGDIYGFDKSKINVICDLCVCLSDGRPVRGNDIASFLRGKNIEPEMISRDYALLMTSFCDTEEAYIRLFEALSEFDADLAVDENAKNAEIERFEEFSSANKVAMKISDAEFAEGEIVFLNDAVGKISLDYITPYPPGIPLVVPGEVISGYVVDKVKKFISDGISVKNGSKVRVK